MAASATVAGSSGRFEKRESPAQDLKRRLQAARKTGLSLGGSFAESHDKRVGGHGTDKRVEMAPGERPGKRPADALAVQCSAGFESKLSQRAKRFHHGIDEQGSSPERGVRGTTIRGIPEQGGGLLIDGPRRVVPTGVGQKRSAPGDTATSMMASGMANIRIKSFDEIMREKRARREASAAAQKPS
jgi:hypothetical protein